MNGPSETHISPDQPRPEAVDAILDVLFLAVIRAHPREGKRWEEQKRLNQVKSALFGTDAPRGRATHDDIPEMLRMADGYIRERGEPMLKETYELNWPELNAETLSFETQLATAALEARMVADPTYKPHNRDEKIRNLQQKFHRNIQDWLKITYGQSGLAENVFRLKLRELSELLAPLGIQINEPGEILRSPKGTI